MPRPRSCCVYDCPGDTGDSWDGPLPLAFFRVPAIISEKNKRFCGYGQEERQKRVIELSRKRRRAWLKIMKKEYVPDDKILKICARHFISGVPADLEDANNPDWIPSLNLGYHTNKIGKAQSAVKRHARHKIKEQRAEAVTIYGGSSDPPVFVEAETLDETADSNFENFSEGESSSKEARVAHLEPPVEMNDNEKNGEILVENAAGDVNIPNILSSEPKEKYGHWHVHFCTKKTCLFSKEAAKYFSLNPPHEDE